MLCGRTKIKYFFSFIFCFIIVFLLGRWSVRPPLTTLVEYISGEVIRDTIWADKLEPFSSVLTDSNFHVITYKELPPKTQQVASNEAVEVLKEIDYTESFKKLTLEYNKRHSYNQTVLQNDTVGTLTVGAVVQYNSLQELYYSFTPVSKVITQHTSKRKEVIPYLRGWQIGKSTGIGAGVYVNSFGFEFVYDIHTDKFGVGLTYKLK